MNILHLSDFHYKPSDHNSFKRIANELLESIKENIPVIDLVVFSGDLVFEGNSKESFDKAFSVLLEPILSTYKLSLDHLMLAPGNHDMQRDAEMPAIRESLDRISDLNGIRDFLSNKKQLDGSLDNFEAFKAFNNTKFRHRAVDPFINIQKTTINGLDLVLIDLNSAWRAFESKTDRGNLLFPVDRLEDIINGIDEECMVMCNLHHSLSDFKDFIEQNIEDIIYNRCHFLFTGHYHKKLTSAVSGQSIGLLHNRAAAVYNRHDKSSKYGYCVVEYNHDNLEAKITHYRYIDDRYVKLETVNHSIPVGETKKEINDFRKTIRRLEQRAIDKADDLFVSGRRSSDGCTTFSRLFVEPVLKTKSIRDLMISKSKGETYSLEQIINSGDDYIIYGLDKCGKTSLLWKLLLDTYRDYYKLNAVPYYLNRKDWNGDNPKPLIKTLSQMLEINQRKTIDIFQHYELWLFIDNYQLDGNDAFNEWLKGQLNDFGKIRIVATASETIVSGYKVILQDNQEATKLFIHEITRKELHKLAERWPNLTDYKRKEIEKRITQVFDQMHIPFNYWTASLFFWIFEKTDETNIHNNFELVKLYIDELLNRKGIVMGKILDLQYDDLLSYLGELAHELLFHNNYMMSYTELVDFTDKYRDKKKKFTETTKRTIDNLLVSGTLFERSSDKYTFRLKGVWEFFLAYHMTENKNFLKDVLDHLEYYLSFGNELELYAGFQKEDKDFVAKIFAITKDITESLWRDDNYENVDDRLIEKVSHYYEISQVVKRIAESSELLEEDEEDDEMLCFAQGLDTSEVQLKKYYSTIEPNIANIQRALFILARVYRNSRICDDKLGDSILQFVLTGVCNLGIMIHDDFKETFTDEKMKPLVENFGAMIPAIIQAYLYDALCQNNLSRVFEEKLDELVKKPTGNQFRIFLLTFCLIDLDPNKYVNRLKELSNILKKGALRFASKLKCAFIYSKENDLTQSTIEDMRSFIVNIEIELSGNKHEAQAILDSIDRKRELHLITMKRQVK